MANEARSAASAARPLATGRREPDESRYTGRTGNRNVAVPGNSSQRVYRQVRRFRTSGTRVRGGGQEAPLLSRPAAAVGPDSVAAGTRWRLPRPRRRPRSQRVPAPRPAHPRPAHRRPAHRRPGSSRQRQPAAAGVSVARLAPDRHRAGGRCASPRRPRLPTSVRGRPGVMLPPRMRSRVVDQRDPERQHDRDDDRHHDEAHVGTCHETITPRLGSYPSGPVA